MRKEEGRMRDASDTRKLESGMMNDESGNNSPDSSFIVHRSSFSNDFQPLQLKPKTSKAANKTVIQEVDRCWIPVVGRGWPVWACGVAWASAWGSEAAGAAGVAATAA